MPAGGVHSYSTLSPQGSSKPFSAPSTPRVTLSPEATSIPPAGPAFAIGFKRALPGFCSKRSSNSPLGFSKIRGGSDERSFWCRWSTVSPVSRSKTPAEIVCRSLASRESRPSVSSSPSNTLAGSAVRSLLASLNLSSPPRSAKSPRLSVAMPELRRSSRSVNAARCASVTSEQLVTLLSFALTSSTSLSRTWGVRSQMPPVSASSDPSTLWPACAASAV